MQQSGWDLTINGRTEVGRDISQNVLLVVFVLKEQLRGAVHCLQSDQGQ